MGTSRIKVSFVALAALAFLIGIAIFQFAQILQSIDSNDSEGAYLARVSSNSQIEVPDAPAITEAINAAMEPGVGQTDPTVSVDRVVELLVSNKLEAYPQIARELSPDSRRSLFKALDDPAYAFNWRQLVQLISYMENSEEALESLISFATSSAHQIPPSITGTSDVYFEAKFKAVTLVGRFEFEKAREFLQLAVTEDGATVLAQDWLDDIERGAYERSQEYYLRVLRSSAARGLAYTQDERSLQLLREEFEAAASDMRGLLGSRLAPDETQRHMTEEEYLVYLLYSTYLDAVAFAELIADMGRKEFFDAWIHMSTDQKLASITPYVSRYTVNERRFQLKDPPLTSLN